MRFWSPVQPHRGSIADLRRDARRFAAGLIARGVRPGDVVSYQLANRIEALVALYGAAMAGTVESLDALSGLPDLEHVPVVGEGARPGDLGFDRLIEASPLADLPHVDPAAPALVGEARAVAEFVRTPSGKIKKQLLRDALRVGSEAC